MNIIGLIRYWILARKITLPKNKEQHRILSKIATHVSKHGAAPMPWEERTVFRHYDVKGNILHCMDRENALARTQLNAGEKHLSNLLKIYGFEPKGDMQYLREQNKPEETCCTHGWRRYYRFKGYGKDE